MIMLRWVIPCIVGGTTIFGGLGELGDNGLVASEAWSSLFQAAFRDSRNAMCLADDARHIVDVNGACLQLLGYRRADVVDRPMYEFVVGEPIMTPRQWTEALGRRRFTGEGEMVRADGATVRVQWGATTELVTGRRLVLVVALSISGRGRGLRPARASEAGRGPLSDRQREIVRLVALGNTGPEIADELQISHNTVRTHLGNSMKKVGARSRAQLVAKALGEGHALAP
jgi:PAS domain S-box-containing protein